MKRVLILSFDFPPQGGVGVVRVTKFVKYLPQFGWEPVGVTSDTLWNPDPSLLEELPADLSVYRVPWPAALRRVLPRNPQAALGAPSTRASGSARLKATAKRLLRALILPDLTRLWTYKAYGVCRQALEAHPCAAMVSTSPPNSIHLLAQTVHARTGLPWVADFRDVWSVADSPWMQAAGPIGRWRHRALERGVLRACQRALMMTAQHAAQTEAVFGAWVRPKLMVLPNGFDAQDFSAVPEATPNDTLEILYVGTLLDKQARNALPEGLHMAWQQQAGALQNVRVRFVGLLDPAYRARLLAASPLVTVDEPVPHAEAVRLMQRADALLLVLSDTLEHRMIYSSKFYEYLAAGKPMLGIVPEGAARAFIIREGIGWVAHPDAPAEIAQTLLMAVQSLRAEARQYRPSPELVARFERRALTRRLAEILDEITA